MNLTNTQRLLCLLRSLAIRPEYCIRYFMHNIFRRRSPLDLRLPWWSYGAIDEIKKHINSSSCVFEWGSGGSTLFFGVRVANVIAIESKLKWYDIVTQQCERYCPGKVIVDYVPYGKNCTSRFSDSEYLGRLNQSFNVIVIDGIEDTGNERLICFARAEKFATDGTIIILDDFWRYEELLEHNHAKEVKVFKSPGPARFGVTSTALFYY